MHFSCLFIFRCVYMYICVKRRERQNGDTVDSVCFILMSLHFIFVDNLQGKWLLCFRYQLTLNCRCVVAFQSAFFSSVDSACFFFSIPSQTVFIQISNQICRSICIRRYEINVYSVEYVYLICQLVIANKRIFVDMILQ